MAEKAERQGLFIAFNNVPASAFPRRYTLLRRGTVFNDVDVFYNNDNNNESDFRSDHFVFPRFNSVQYVVGLNDMGSTACRHNSCVLAGM